MDARIFITQPIPEPALARLRAAGRVELNADSQHILTTPALREAVRRSDCLVCLQHNAVDASVIDANPRLRLIASMAIEPAGIDVSRATARGIPVTTIPPLVTEATADLHWGLLLAVARRIPEAEWALRRRVFPGAQSMHFLGGEVHGKTLGIVGLGRVGQAIARRARGFSMPLLYADRTRLPEAEEVALGVAHRPLQALLGEADFVSVSVSLAPDTVHLIGRGELGLMRPTAYLINTSRGPVVDEKALAEALTSRRIAGAALDVYEDEPRVEPALLGLTNAVLTPHIGSAAGDTRLRIAHMVADNVVAVLEGRRPPNLYNPEVWP
ncbi:MAG TPA: D-glycerate dehydrogenase [Methylomirabilota bacterium]|nr:D-glycerate dehydrogenase [Methylomirabilota bacterium]